MPKSIRIGVAGLGFGGAVHVPVLQSLPDVSVVGLAASRPAKALAVAERMGVPHSCCGFEELLNLDLDAVSIALPPIIGAEAAKAALKKGLGVLMEKPLAGSARRAAELVGLAEGRTSAMNYIFTGLDTFRAMKKLLDEGRLGRLEKVDVVWTVESWANQNRRWSWKTDADQGGGVLNSLGAHVCFLMDWFCGPVEVMQTRTFDDVIAGFAPPGTKPAEHRVEARLKAGEADIDMALDNGQKTPPLHRWTFAGEGGTAVLENFSDDYFGGFTLRGVPGQADIMEKTSASDDRRFMA